MRAIAKESNVTIALVTAVCVLAGCYGMTAVGTVTQALVNILAVHTNSRVASETRAVVAAFGVITGSFGVTRFI